jgi:hypothetical protein
LAKSYLTIIDLNETYLSNVFTAFLLKLVKNFKIKLLFPSTGSTHLYPTPSLKKNMAFINTQFLVFFYNAIGVLEETPSYVKSPKKGLFYSVARTRFELVTSGL